MDVQQLKEGSCGQKLQYWSLTCFVQHVRRNQHSLNGRLSHLSLTQEEHVLRKILPTMAAEGVTATRKGCG